MVCLILLLSDGNILLCRDPKQGWQKSPLKIPDLAPNTSPVWRVNDSCFWYTAASGKNFIGKFSLARNGEVTIRLSPPLPPDIRRDRRDILTVSASGQSIFVNKGFPTVLRQERNTWKTVGILRTGDSLSGCFDTSERYLCVVQSYRIGVNTSGAFTKIFRITPGGLKKVGFGDVGWPIGSLIPGNRGWFFNAGIGESAYFLPLSHLPQNRDDEYKHYGTGMLAGPVWGNAVALHRFKDRSLRFKNRVVGIVPRDAIETWYWPGVGGVSLVPTRDKDGLFYDQQGYYREIKISVNDLPLSAPDPRPNLYFVTEEKQA